MTVSVLRDATAAFAVRIRVFLRTYIGGRTRGWMPMAAFLVVLLVAVGVVVLLMRAAAASGGGGRPPAPRAPPTRPQPTHPPVAPDDAPDFLRELDRRRHTGEGPTV